MPYNPINQTFDVLNDLRAQKGTTTTQVYLLGLTSMNDGNGGVFIWNDTSTVADDGMNTIAVTGVSTGRWVRSKNSNYNTNTVTFSGVTLQTTYTVNHGLNFTPVKIFITPRSAAAAVPYYISNITSTTFTIVFGSVPLIGTLNIVFDYLAVKQ